ncbi:MAG TPA: hypothetical protein VGX92_18970 [Pyrinomonadaceae bacterium]|jgi:hypothetical protein|nr:hypothetical protein [Pyrinomonadaceae bacterium]
MEHEEIDDLLKQGNLTVAAGRIEGRWLRNIDPMLADVAEASSKRLQTRAKEGRAK